jgi:hypothetical protein
MNNTLKRGLLRSILTLLPLGFGCQKSPQTAPQNPSLESAWPAWIGRPSSVSPLAVVGSEAPNALGDLGLQRSAALAQGRVELGRLLLAQSKGISSGVGQSGAYVGRGRTAGAEALAAREDVWSSMVDVALRGSRGEEFWTDPKTGTLFVLVVLDTALVKADLRKQLEGLGLSQEELRAATERMEQTLKAHRP